jgi:hypothetical protein
MKFDFDATTVEPSQALTPVPAGTYIAQITDSEIKPTKMENGHYLQMTWRILDGPFVNRLIFDRINVKNNNQVAEQIGQRALSAICHACNVLRLQDTQQLHGIPVALKVTIKKDEQYGDKNEVKGYSKVDGAGAPPAAMMAPSPVAFAQPRPHSAPAGFEAAPKAPPIEQAFSAPPPASSSGKAPWLVGR